MPASDAVIIKGVRDGLLFILADDAPFAQILIEIGERIKAQPNFFQGAAVTINSERRVIEAPDFEVLYNILTRNGMRVQTFVSLSAQSRMVAESMGVPSRPPSFAAGDAGMSLGLRGRGSSNGALHATIEGGVSEVGAGLFLRASLRPGQSVHYGGDVCVLGDVEVGAEIIAEGDVIVWGVLKGIVHAGVGGDDEAVVCALQMSPTQLSITGVAARFPAYSERYPNARPSPELARVEQGQIVLETWMGEEPP